MWTVLARGVGALLALPAITVRAKLGIVLLIEDDRTAAYVARIAILEFLAKCVLCVLDNAAKLVGDLATHDETLKNTEVAAAAGQADKLITIAANMLQERGDELHGPISPN